MIHFRFIIFLLLLLVSSSCNLRRLEVQTQYFTHEDLASYYVGTPDPRLDHPTAGQRLLIQWSLSKEEFSLGETSLDLKIRFQNHQEKEVKIPMQKSSGYYVYEIKDKDYFETGGILTYLVEVRNESCTLATWKHPLWVELITFK